MLLCKLIHSDRLFIDFRSDEQTEQKERRELNKQHSCKYSQRVECSEGRKEKKEMCRARQ